MITIITNIATTIIIVTYKLNTEKQDTKNMVSILIL